MGVPDERQARLFEIDLQAQTCRECNPWVTARNRSPAELIWQSISNCCSHLRYHRSVVGCHRSQTHEPRSRVMVCMRLKAPSPIAWPLGERQTASEGWTDHPGQTWASGADFHDCGPTTKRQSDDRDALLGGGCRQGRLGRQALPLLVGFLLPPQPQCFFTSVPIWSTLHQGKTPKGDHLSCHLSLFLIVQRIGHPPWAAFTEARNSLNRFEPGERSRYG